MLQLNRLAARQYSLAHRDQALDLGMTPRQIQARLDVGAGWCRYIRACTGWPAPLDRPSRRVLAACLSAGAGAVASHRSAARAVGLPGRRRRRPEITVPGDRRPDAAPASSSTAPIGSIRSTSPGGGGSRSPRRPGRLLDLGAVAPAQVVESALEDALMRRLITFALLTGHDGAAGRAGAERGAACCGRWWRSGIRRRADAERAGGRAAAAAAAGRAAGAGAAVRGGRRAARLRLPAPAARHRGRQPDLARRAARRPAQQRQGQRAGGSRLAGAALHLGRHPAPGRRTWSTRWRRELALAWPA